MTSAVRPASLVPLLLFALTSGCGFGSAGVAAALGKKDRTVTRTPTQLTLLTPSAGQSGRVPLSTGLDVDPNEALTVETVEFSLLGAQGTFRSATVAPGFPNEITLGDTITGATIAARTSKFFTYVWNSHHDLDALQTAGTITRPVSARTVLRVRIRNTRTGETITRSTDEFFIDQSLMATVAGGGVGDGNTPATASMLDPTGVVALSTSSAFVADTGNHRIRQVTFTGATASSVTTAIGTGFQGVSAGTQAATLTSLDAPVAVAADGNGNLFVAENDSSGGSRLRTYERATGLVFDLLNGFAQVNSVQMSTQRQLYIAETGNNAVWRLDLATRDPFLDPPAFGDLVSLGAFAQPRAVAARSDGGTDTIYIAKGGDLRVARIVGSGAASDVAGGGAQAPAVGLDARQVALVEPFALAAAPTHFYIADRSANLVIAVDNTTLLISNVITTVTLDDNTTRTLQRPAGLAADGNGNLLIVETGGAIVPGAVGHQLLFASTPATTTAQLRQLAAGGAVKQVTQSVAGIAQATASLVYERTPRTG